MVSDASLFVAVIGIMVAIGLVYLHSAGPSEVAATDDEQTGSTDKAGWDTVRFTDDYELDEMQGWAYAYHDLLYLHESEQQQDLRRAVHTRYVKDILPGVDGGEEADDAG